MKKNLYMYDFQDENEKNKDTIKESDYHGIKKHYLEIKSEGKFKGKVGRYISLKIEDDTVEEDIEHLISKDVKMLLKTKIKKKNPRLLIFGIGNEYFSSDSLGPETIKKLQPYLDISSNKKRFLFIPGVKALTGFDTSITAKTLIKQYKIDAVIAIDSLITNREERLYKIIQITDTGITPGSGLRNNLISMNEHFLNVPVIAIGVGTCLSARSIIDNFVEKLDIEKEIKTKIKKQIEHDSNYYTLKDTEEIISTLSRIISKSIVKAFF